MSLLAGSVVLKTGERDRQSEKENENNGSPPFFLSLNSLVVT
jgi:hypothetical protein